MITNEFRWQGKGINYIQEAAIQKHSLASHSVGIMVSIVWVLEDMLPVREVSYPW